MKHGFYLFIFAFTFAFASVFAFWNAGVTARMPASTDAAADSTAAQAAMDEANTIYNQAIMQNNNHIQGAAAYSMALQNSMATRQQYVAEHPNQFMWPGNSFDTQYSDLLAANAAIGRDSSFNLQYNALQILYIKKKNKNILSAAQENELDQKYRNLVTLMSASTSNGLYTYPPPNNPLFVNVPPGSFTGPQQIALNLPPATPTPTPIIEPEVVAPIYDDGLSTIAQ